MTERRLMIMIQQSPFDPGSGAARSTLYTAALLVQLGWQVKCVSTTATEHAECDDTHTNWLLEQGWKSPAVWRRFGVDFHLLPAGQRASTLADAFKSCVSQILNQWQPQILLTFGDTDIERELRETAQLLGCKVLFALHNLAYRDTCLIAVDHVVVPSRFLAERYPQYAGKHSVMYPPLLSQEVIAPEAERCFLTLVNPEPAKGLYLILGLIAWLAANRPDIPVLLVEGRLGHAQLVREAQRCGMQLDAMENLFLSARVLTPSQIYTHTRVALMPSIVEESAGRVAMEAMLNGIPVIVSDRGGLPEIAGSAGTVLPLPQGLTPRSSAPIPAEALQPWISAITQLFDDSAFYQQHVDRCQHHAQTHFSEAASLVALESAIERTLQ